MVKNPFSCPPKTAFMLGCWILAALTAWQMPRADLRAAEGRRLAVNVPVANIRAGPGESYRVLWKAEKHFPMRVLETSTDWYRFKDFEGDEGWIHQSLTTAAETVITRKAECNIRKGPGTRFAVLLTVDAGIPFKIIRKKGPWLNIMHADGDQGWIHQSLVW